MGHNEGSITASYAFGSKSGGDDNVGGLVGSNNSRSSIRASYATGAVHGSAQRGTVGGLVGHNEGSITASYAFGSKSGGEAVAYFTPHDGTAKPDGVTSANGLTATNAGTKWNDAAQKTLNAWDFGSNTQAPALKYADYDGAGASSVDYCAMFPTKIPGTGIDLECGKSLLPNQPGR